MLLEGIKQARSPIRDIVKISWNGSNLPKMSRRASESPKAQDFMEIAPEYSQETTNEATPAAVDVNPPSEPQTAGANTSSSQATGIIKADPQIKIKVPQSGYRSQWNIRMQQLPLELRREFSFDIEEGNPPFVCKFMYKNEVCRIGAPARNKKVAGEFAAQAALVWLDNDSSSPLRK